MSEKKQVFNPFLPLNEYIPDGEPHVFGQRVYLFGSHDCFDSDGYCMNDYVCYSAAVHDLNTWRYEGIIYRKNQDPRNSSGTHCLWAPDVVKGLDGRYYLYYCLDVLPEIGVAVCDTPAGEYQYLGLVHYEDGMTLGRREGDFIQFDPGVFIDDDESIYLYSGNGPKIVNQLEENKASQVMKLKADMLTIAEEPKLLIPTLKNSSGTTFSGHEFFEASSIRKINGNYYLIYSDIHSYTLCYAVSKFPDRDYQYKGTILALGDIGINGRKAEAARNCLGNTHGSIEYINGQWYVFYHRQTHRTMFNRQACAEKIDIKPDGTIKQVEMTSCGLNDGALAGEGTYMAAIACNLWTLHRAMPSRPEQLDESFPYFTQDGTDGDEQSVPYIANMRNGSIAGYKYFTFEQANRISVEVRGVAEGKILIYTHLEEAAIGEIAIKVSGELWVSFSGESASLKGLSALYFRYEGSGVLDICSFSLWSENE